MARDLAAGTLAASIAEVVRPFIAVELDFASGMVRANSTHRALAFDPGGGVQTFPGVGKLGSISPPQEGVEIRAYGLTLKLSGVDAANIALALTEHYQGRAGRVWLGLLDADWLLVDAPVLVFSGRMDDMPVSIGETGEVAVNLESTLTDWERPRVSRYTDSDQQAKYPGDLGCAFAAQMVEREVVWGRG